MIEFNKSYRVKKETSNELPTELQERLKQNQERNSLPEIKVLLQIEPTSVGSIWGSKNKNNQLKIISVDG